MKRTFTQQYVCVRTYPDTHLRGKRRRDYPATLAEALEYVSEMYGIDVAKVATSVEWHHNSEVITVTSEVEVEA